MMEAGLGKVSISEGCLPQVKFNTQLVARRTPWHRSVGWLRDKVHYHNTRMPVGFIVRTRMPGFRISNSFTVRCFYGSFYHNRYLVTNVDHCVHTRDLRVTDGTFGITNQFVVLYKNE